MIIGLEGFGSVWSCRIGASRETTAFYNTTGVTLDADTRDRRPASHDGDGRRLGRGRAAGGICGDADRVLLTDRALVDDAQRSALDENRRSLGRSACDASDGRDRASADG